MPKPRNVRQVLSTILLTLVFVTSVCAGSKNFIQVVNKCNNSMWFYYKSYTNNPWENNTCPSKNTKTIILPDSSYIHQYEYNNAMTCKNIYVTYGRNDQSCERCSTTLKAGFDKAQPKILIIQGNCQGGSTDFTMEPIGGSVIK